MSINVHQIAGQHLHGHEAHLSNSAECPERLKDHEHDPSKSGGHKLLGKVQPGQRADIPEHRSSLPCSALSPTDQIKDSSMHAASSERLVMPHQVECNWHVCTSQTDAYKESQHQQPLQARHISIMLACAQCSSHRDFPCSGNMNHHAGARACDGIMSDSKGLRKDAATMGAHHLYMHADILDVHYGDRYCMLLSK